MEDYINHEKILENCTFVKTILMIIIVAYHSMLFWGGQWFTVQQVVIKSNILKYITVWLNTFHIFGFTLVSGYLFEYLKHENNRYQEFLSFLINKTKRLLIPYLFVAFFWIIPNIKIWHLYTNHQIINKFVLCTGPSQLWFLWMLFDVFIIIYLINKCVMNDQLAFLISIISWAIGFIGNKCYPNIFCIWTALTYLPYFIIGMKIREKKELCYI